jgi:CRISPR-associated protein Csh1
MLKALKDFGEFIGLEKGFEAGLNNVSPGDKIVVIAIDQNGSFKVEETIEFEKDRKYPYSFYYRGKNSVTGTTGILGITPFFLTVSKLTVDKIEKSGEYIERYKKHISADTLMTNFLDYLKKHCDEIRELSTVWVYVNEFYGKTTEDIHKKFIELDVMAKRNKNIESINGKCDLCGNVSELCYPRFPFFALDVSNYNYNLTSNRPEDSRLKVCKTCEPYIVAGWKALNNLFGGQRYILVPKLRDSATNDSLRKFVQLVNNNLSSFEKLNSVLGDRKMDEEVELSFVVMRREQQKTVIEKFVPNYKTFAIGFEYESLIQGDELEYVDGKSKNVVVPEIHSFFELERLLKYFFVYTKNQRLSEYFHFYQLYNRGIPENKKMQMDSNFKHLLYIYRDNFFSFIYETNLSALNNKLLNDIGLNFLLYEIRKQRDFWDNKAETNLAFKILESFNYYYFLKHKIVGDVKMKEQILNLKSEFGKLEEENTKQGAEKRIEEIIEKDDRLVYYLIGQFIKKIDDFRGYKGKNKIFDDFVQSINRKSIKQRFAEDILQKQNYYIERLNPKAKFVFDIMANNLDKLFEYEPYEEMVISLITGYYSNDILKSSKAGGEVNGE